MKSTNGALPRDSIELNARQNEKIKNLKRQEKKKKNRRPRSSSRGLQVQRYKIRGMQWE